eukprot:TRINITY_DN4718_c0_g1_i1.p2 TRINITY_DN4718_c0_g1~~TRINITY_DN4718_c0_g1_i1.p2  ORF type:complete len:101 (+),score=12.53 TRINITY_DN4718_c0_g1_i1:446-748(+)
MVKKGSEVAGTSSSLSEHWDKESSSRVERTTADVCPGTMAAMSSILNDPVVFDAVCSQVMCWWSRVSEKKENEFVVIAMGNVDESSSSFTRTKFDPDTME